MTLFRRTRALLRAAAAGKDVYDDRALDELDALIGVDWGIRLTVRMLRMRRRADRLPLPPKPPRAMAYIVDRDTGDEAPNV